MPDPIAQPTEKIAGSQPAPEEAANAAVLGTQKADLSTGAVDVKPDEKPVATDKTPEFIEKDGQKFYKSFDQHPDWKALQDSKKAVSGILEENGYATMDDLVTDLKAGHDIKVLLGDQDAQTLIDNSNNWNNAQEYWAEEESKKVEEGETATETVARLKDENKNLKDTQQREETDRKAANEGKQTLTRYDKDVSGIVDGHEGLSDSEKSIAKIFLGVGNPMDDVDVTDAKAVRLAAKDGVDKIETFIKAIRQEAVNKYSKGKSEIVPIATGGAEDIAAVEPKKVVLAEKGEVDIDKAFSDANKLIMELAVSGELDT